MKKFIIFIIFLFSGFSYAVDEAKVYEGEIIRHIIESLFHKEDIKVCLYNFSLPEKKIYKELLGLKVVNNCKKANIILVKNLEDKKSFEKPALSLDYLSFKNCNNCIGGFYWRKGRPQIVLIRELLDYYNLKPDRSLKNFIISKKMVRR